MPRYAKRPNRRPIRRRLNAKRPSRRRLLDPMLASAGMALAADTINRYGPSAVDYAVSSGKSYYNRMSAPSATPSGYNGPARRVRRTRRGIVAASGPALRRAIRLPVKKQYVQKKSNFILDMVSPPVEEDYRELGPHLDASSNLQDVRQSIHITNAKIVQMIKKAKDCQNINFKFALDPVTGSNLDENGRLNYTGGWQKHTFVNSSTHTAYLTLYDMTCKMNCDNAPAQCWSLDLVRDQTLTNVETPVNVEQVIYTTKLEPQRNAVEFHMKWKTNKKLKVIMAPGETYIYFMRHPKFYVDTGRWNIADNGVTKTYIKGITKALMFTAYGEIVTTTADAAVTTGSFHISHNVQECNRYRCPLPQRQVMRYASGSFGVVASAGNEFTYNEETDTKASAYTEL